VQTRFLLGPAGSGKTFRCLAEIREELLKSPEGPPLLLLAPKQATFQLERQLLDSPGWGERPREPLAQAGVGSPGVSSHHEDVRQLPGYTRLQILSFDRLAAFILGEFGDATRELLEEEGRVMVLRALLGRHRSQLKIFHATARLPGFAQQLNLLLREFQRQQLSPRRLAALADQLQAQPTLAAKLHDAALLLDAYLGWLQAHGLQDANCLPDLAADALRKTVASGRVSLRVGGLWLDGFAEMTPQELDLLAAILPICEHATLAFCLAAEARENTSWLSGWSVVEHTFRQCRERVAALTDSEVSVESLKRDPARSRFQGQPLLGLLEQCWERPNDPTLHAPRSTLHASPVRLVTCANPEMEATLAAREVLRFVRGGGRFREAAVLVRSLEPYHDALRRVFTRYGIPFFLDRREPVAHHPLAELTRYAMRLAAFGWQHDDWFGALKTGLANDDAAAIDRLENEALARGWQGNAWFQPLKTPGDPGLEKTINRCREKIIAPFSEWNRALALWQRRPDGRQLAAALRGLWEQLAVAGTLERWSADAPERSPIHLTVLDQMNAWLDNVELAFGDEALPLGDWLPILEAGLANLSVGVIPPALDQVLIGAIDRSRNPELKLVLLPGWNETVFPALPAPGPLLTETERDAMAGQNVPLGPGRRQQIGQERYYAYIACTRARQRLVITCAARNATDRVLYPSPFFERIKQITGIAGETFNGPEDWRKSEHVCEMAAPVLRAQSSPDRQTALIQLGELPAIAPLVLKWRQLRESSEAPRLTPRVTERLYGRELPSSVSGLEDFAACPFKFFASRGLRLQERKEYQFDDRDKGSFQHEVLREFHRRVRESGRRWRDLGAAGAGDLACAIGRELLPDFGGGRFLAAGAARFTGEFLIERLGRLVAVLVEWMPQYEFDPERVEISFGLEPDGLPAWRIELPDDRALLLRGRIDRVDLCRADNDTVLAVVMDYKSSAHTLNPTKLHHGLELQLLSYLGVLRHLAEPGTFFAAAKLSPAGVFYVPLNGGGGRPGATRADIVGGGDAARRAAYQHRGRFLADALKHFDNRGLPRGDQFKFARNRDGEFSARGNEAMPAAEFEALREKIEGHLRDYGRRIFAGEADVSPFRAGKQAACDRCDFRPVCRFDPWTQSFRDLRPPPRPSRKTPSTKGQPAGAKK
jgi:ATP-dependent helicase/nuclease subunit B